ncbi:MAG: endolytic transglycosylase MltG [Desulfobacterales bacterium]|jgi:UPF0755 protein
MSEKDSTPPPPKPGPRRPLKVVIPALLLLIAAAAFVAVQDIRLYAEKPVPPVSGKEQLLTIAPGESFRSITRKLLALGLIRSPLRFRILARISGHHRNLKAGEYSFEGPSSPRNILERLVEGKVKLYRITVPEGSTLEQIAGIVEASGLSDRDAFLSAAAAVDPKKAYGIDGATLEGYLFPDTYHLPKNSSAADIIDTMVGRFKDVMTDKRRKRAENIGLSIHEVVTLASIIEKETGAPAERPQISSVFHNRLKRGMRLETDPTVIYGIKDFDGNLTRKHLRTPTPYNTYLIKGLPPGPIANPGEASIDAALYPAQTGYLFFVSRKDGTHHFSASLKEHQQAVRKYQLGGRKRKATKGGSQ